MPVGKAKAAAKETAGEEFRLIVPCFTSVDESHISDQPTLVFRVTGECGPQRLEFFRVIAQHDAATRW